MPPHASAPFTRSTALLLLLVVGAVWFANLGHRALQHPDEGRYAEIAREMVATGDWITPRLNGLKYLEKPPLQYWLTAATFELFGPQTWTARLWPALAGLLGVAAIAWAGARVGGRALAWSAGLALAGTLWQVALSQIFTLDALLSFLLSVAFAAVVVAQRAQASGPERRRTMWLAWAALAGATLTKGLIGVVIPGAALVLYSLVTRDWAVWRRLHLGSGLLIYFAITAPWFVAVARANPEFLAFFFVHEHFARFLTPVHRRTQSVWYFVPLLAAGVMPWLTLMAFGAVRAWREGTPNALGFSWQRFGLTWAAFVFTFFSLSNSKLASYILPLFPPLALVAGWLLLRYSTATLARIVLPLALAALALALAVVLDYPGIATQFHDRKILEPAVLAFGPWVQAGFAVAAAGAWVAFAAFRRGERGRFAGIAALSVSTLVTAQIIVAGLDQFRGTRSSYDILAAAAAQLPDRASLSSADIPFFQVEMYDQTLPFYLRRTTTVVAFEGELALGIAADPDRAIGDTDAWVQRWSALPAGFAIMEIDDYHRFAARDVPMRILAQDTRRVVVSRR